MTALLMSFVLVRAIVDLVSRFFIKALAPVPDIIGVERAHKDYAFIMRRFSVLINRRQEGMEI